MHTAEAWIHPTDILLGFSEAENFGFNLLQQNIFGKHLDFREAFFY